MSKSPKRELYQIRVTDQELAAILAGLRLLQAAGHRAELLEILTDGGRFAPLMAEDLDALSERLNIE